MNKKRLLRLQITGMLTLVFSLIFFIGNSHFFVSSFTAEVKIIAPLLFLVLAIGMSDWLLKYIHRTEAFSEESRRQLQGQLQEWTELDVLTRLPNRIFLQSRLTQALHSARLETSQIALLCIDLDRFKNINDSLGHAIGDQLLIEVAQRLATHLEHKHIVSRPGGDEFVVLIEHLQNAEHAAQIADNLLKTVDKPYRIGEHELAVTLSIGIALFPEDGNDAETLLKHADAAMYHAKAQGRNTCQFFTLELHKRVREHLEIENRLRHALTRREISLHYQPQIDLETGRLMGCEALMRWENPQLGRIPPDKFIGIAEDSGLILRLGEWALFEACQQSMQWRNQGLPALRMSVNVSAIQFKQSSKLVKHIEHALKSSGLPASDLELELTESVLADNLNQVKSALERLKQLGIRLAMDDFGTGYSSLSYLRQLRLDTLKIDRSFVNDLPNSEDCAALTTAILNMAEALGMHCVAEGIENDDQLSFLRWHGCQIGQGYFFSKPLTAEAMAAFLTAYQPPPEYTSLTPELDDDAETLEDPRAWLANGLH